MKRRPPEDAWSMTPRHCRCPDCGVLFQNGVCPECQKKAEIPPVPAWWPAALLAALAVLTALFSLFAPAGLAGLCLAFAGACCAALAGCVVWFWAAFRYGLDKRVLLRVMMTSGGLFVLDMVAIAVCALAGG